MDVIASEYLLYFNETSELVFNFADPLVYLEDTSSSPTALSIEMITNSLPFTPTLVTDYSEGVGYGTLKVTINGQAAYVESTEQLTEDGGEIEINGIVTIRVSY